MINTITFDQSENEYEIIIQKRYKYYKQKKKNQEYCSQILWKSAYDDTNILIEVIYYKIYNGKDNYKVHKIYVPGNTPERDQLDMSTCFWYIIAGENRNKKYPQVYQMWQRSENFWIASCYPPNNESQIPFAKQLKDMKDA